MGSGHFLARAMDFLAEAIATDSYIKPPLKIGEDSELTYYRRRVVESCIYGVDLNPLAVELAKLTLWLGTMAKSKPLSFLNHHLRVGNSLIGARVANLDEIPKVKGKKGKSVDLSRAPVQLGLFQEAFNKKLYDLQIIMVKGIVYLDIYACYETLSWTSPKQVDDLPFLNSQRVKYNNVVPVVQRMSKSVYFTL